MTDQNRVILTKLALDRCLSHLSHIHSIVYLTQPSAGLTGKTMFEGVGMDGVTVRNLFSILDAMRRDLQLGQENLQLDAQDEGQESQQ